MNINDYIDESDKLIEQTEYIDSCKEYIYVLDVIIQEASMFFGALDMYINLDFWEIMQKKFQTIDGNSTISQAYSDIKGIIEKEKQFFQNIFNSSFEWIILMEFLMYFWKEENNKKFISDFILETKLNSKQKRNLLAREELYMDLYDKLLFALNELKYKSEEEIEKYSRELEIQKIINDTISDEERILNLNNIKIKELEELKISIIRLLSLFQENNKDTILYLDRFKIINLVDRISELLETNSNIFNKNIYSSYFIQFLEYFSVKEEYSWMSWIDKSVNNFTSNFDDFNDMFLKHFEELIKNTRIEWNNKKLLEEDLEILKNSSEEFISRVISYFEIWIKEKIKSLEY